MGTEPETTASGCGLQVRDRHMLTAEQFLEAERVLALVPAALLDELEAAGEMNPNLREVHSGEVITRGSLAAHNLTAPLRSTIRECEGLFAAPVGGGYRSDWTAFREGFVVELRRRHRDTELVWEATFNVSPLAQTATGRAVLAKRGLNQLTTLATSAGEAAAAAATSARMAEAAEQRAMAAQDGEKRAERRAVDAERRASRQEWMAWAALVLSAIAIAISLLT